MIYDEAVPRVQPEGIIQKEMILEKATMAE